VIEVSVRLKEDELLADDDVVLLYNRKRTVVSEPMDIGTLTTRAVTLMLNQLAAQDMELDAANAEK
jgi:urease accessory protein UreE